MNDRELMYALLRVLRHIQKTINAIHNEQRAQTHQQQLPPQFDIQSPIRLPPAVHDYYASEERDRPKKTRIEKTRLALECIGAVAAICAAIFTLETLSQVRTQADAAQKQVGIMQAQNRAWIKIMDVRLRESIPPILTLSFQRFRPITGQDTIQASLQIELALKNIGHSVAQMITVTPELFFTPASPTDFMDAVKKEESRVCNETLNRKPDVGARSAIFPDEVSTWDLGVETIINLTQLVAAPHDPVKGYVSGVLIACVNYTFGPIAEQVHPQTRVVYHIYADRTRFLKVGEDIPAERMKIVRDQSEEYAQ